MNSLEASKIANLINQADWYYHYTDDYSAYLRGEASVGKVRHAAEERLYTDDEVDLIKHEIENILKLNYGNKESYQKRYVYLAEKVDSMFRNKK